MKLESILTKVLLAGVLLAAAPHALFAKESQNAGEIEIGHNADKKQFLEYRGNVLKIQGWEVVDHIERLANGRFLVKNQDSAGVYEAVEARRAHGLLPIVGKKMAMKQIGETLDVSPLQMTAKGIIGNIYQKKVPYFIPSSVSRKPGVHLTPPETKKRK